MYNKMLAAHEATVRLINGSEPTDYKIEEENDSPKVFVQIDGQDLLIASWTVARAHANRCIGKNQVEIFEMTHTTEGSKPGNSLHKNFK